MSSPKRRSEAQTPRKASEAATGTPAHTPSPNAKKSKMSTPSPTPARTTPKPRASTEQSLPQTSPAPRAPPTTPVPTRPSKSHSEAKNVPSPAKKKSKSASKGHHADGDDDANTANSFVIDVAEPTTTTATTASVPTTRDTTSMSKSRKRAHSDATGRSASRVTLHTEEDVAEDEATAGQAALSNGTHIPAAMTELLRAHGNKNGTAAAAASSSSSSAASAGLRSLVEQTVLQTHTIAPDVSGIRCFTFNEREDDVVVAREDGSLAAYHLAYHQNIPHFTLRRHTGGCLRRTVTRLAFVRVPVTNSEAAAAVGAERDGDTLFKTYLLASYLSGQLVFLDTETLFPVSVHQRTGGAIWDFCIAPDQSVVYAAVADGSWHQLLLTLERYTPAHGQGSEGSTTTTATGGSRTLAWRPSLVLERIVPGVPGADRALSVTCSLSQRLVVGTDDAGNVNAWRLRRERDDAQGTTASAGSAATLGRGLVDHETAWTTRLPKGIPLCVAVSASGKRPAVAVGTSMGDVVLLDADTGDVFATFSQHKGPVSTITFDHDAFFASGWHDSLRAYRCTEDGEWYPAEVKRRTHYHEATQVAVLPRRQLLLSAARDGTLLYAPVSQVFTAPAMYLRASTQQFTFAREKNVLVQTRLNRIEAFRMDNAQRHWSPLFSYTLAGHFHINRLWCDEALHYMVITTDDRVVLLKVCWREGAEAALVLSRLEEVVELPAARGVLDVCFAPHQSAGQKDAATAASAKVDEEADASSFHNDGNVYVLYDENIIQVSLTPGYAAVVTALASGSSASAGLHPRRIFVLPSRAAAPVSDATPKKASKKAVDAAVDTTSSFSAPSSCASLVVYGREATWRCELTADGLPNTDTVTISHGDALALSQLVPALGSATASRMLVGLSATTGRYVYSLVDATADADTSSLASSSAQAPIALPRTLPHDCTFVAYMPINTAELPNGGFSLSALQRSASSEAESNSNTRPTKARREEGTTADDDARQGRTEYLLFGYFSKGILVANKREWRMLHRCSMDTAAALKDGAHVLYVEQNLERTLEALPLCWKVRRFGN